MADVHPKVLLVEGKQDVRVIPELIEANGINWGTRKSPIVYIRDYDGYQNLVDPDIISTELRASGLSALGIMIDADDNPLGRWQSIRTASLKSIPDIPEALPEEGLIHTTPNGIQFGIWLMPDNKMRGMLETFLTYMIPRGNEVLWEFAQEAALQAKSKGAVFTDPHVDKANIYTWLAWQNPPGRQLHQAIMERILDPNHPNAQRFVTWFKTLYGLG
ncbi:hypothetical protein G7B40_023310 [Aetokthonos hydrillicola Thurmond2011]|jgi:hypothetical protein|uniref:Uncharacterized protein n=1 Tax=Aetokthonos hydrillicola Thurmond2011 TaxID=2712845 RepID=A0AAP5I9J8_9CYAN|nr:DUF3226 domain-containing protein [Aetokthonos hydrillicola]MBW4586344.1 hypothetical protein [Aetokthonos hydrillicola CCALA 1050]MDR9897472.1 hypothetical protein [Aetokthonos hydrillicola Thurmond2011]